jgi:hypothetical protein
MQYAWETGEGRAVFWWGNVRERDHLEHLVVDDVDLAQDGGLAVCSF